MAAPGKASGKASGRSSRKRTPAEQRAAYDRSHGITPDIRRRATTTAVVGSIVLFVVTVLGLGLLAPRLGLQPSIETHGSGTVRVDDCASAGVGLHACQATVTSWDGTSRSTGDAVSVISRTPLAGTVDVVARNSTGSVLDKDGYRFTTHAEWIMPADQPVLSQGARAGVIVGALAVWLVASWVLARLVWAAAARRAARTSAS